MGMTLTEFRKSGWSKEFAQFDEAELATIILCVRSLSVIKQRRGKDLLQ